MIGRSEPAAAAAADVDPTFSIYSNDGRGYSGTIHPLVRAH